MAAKYLRRTAFDDPSDLGRRQSTPDEGKRRQRVNDVPDSAEFYDEDSHVTALP
jgi:hypothetical protein